MSTADAPTPTPSEFEWARRVRRMEFDSLERLQAVAEKWRTGLSALAGLVTATAAIAAPFVGSQLEGKPRAFLGVLVLLSISSLCGGAWTVMRASFGMPTEIMNSGSALRAWTEQETSTVRKCIKSARFLTVVGLISLIAAVGIGFFASNGDYRALLQASDGQEYCGRLGQGEDGSLRLTSADGTTRIFLPAELSSIELDSDC